MAIYKSRSIANTQGRELVEHGTTMLPVACYLVHLAKDTVPWHWHDDLEVFIVEKGTAVIALGNGNIKVKEGEGVFINSGVLHSAWDADQSDSCLHSIVFHPRFIGGSIESVFWQNYLNPLIKNQALPYLHFDHSKAWHQETQEAVETAWHSSEKEGSGYEFQLWFSLSRLILALTRHQSVSRVQSSAKCLRDNERIKIMLRYIQEHYQSVLSIAQIAGAAMIGKSECLRCFKSTIGTSPIQYVKQFRIQKSTELLKHTDEKISDIAVKCGFLDMSYFSKSFKELLECTPVEYRKKVDVS